MPRNLVASDRAGKRGGVGYQGVVARRSAWPGPPHPRREGTGRLPTDLGEETPHWSREDGQLPSLPGLFVTLPGASRAGPVHAQGLPCSRTPREEEAASSRVWEGKLRTLCPRHKSPPSNGPREKLQRILSRLVAQLCSKVPLQSSNISPSASVTSRALAGLPTESGLRTRANPEDAEALLYPSPPSIPRCKLRPQQGWSLKPPQVSATVGEVD